MGVHCFSFVDAQKSSEKQATNSADYTSAFGARTEFCSLPMGPKASRITLSKACISNLPVTETGHEVVVDHAGRLHVRIYDSRPYKLESAQLQFFADQIRFWRSSRHL